MKPQLVHLLFVFVLLTTNVLGLKYNTRKDNNDSSDIDDDEGDSGVSIENVAEAKVQHRSLDHVYVKDDHKIIKSAKLTDNKNLKQSKPIYETGYNQYSSFETDNPSQYQYSNSFNQAREQKPPQQQQRQTVYDDKPKDTLREQTINSQNTQNSNSESAKTNNYPDKPNYPQQPTYPGYPSYPSYPENPSSSSPSSSSPSQSFNCMCFPAYTNPTPYPPNYFHYPPQVMPYFKPFF